MDQHIAAQLTVRRPLVTKPLSTTHKNAPVKPTSRSNKPKSKMKNGLVLKLLNA